MAFALCGLPHHASGAKGKPVNWWIAFCESYFPFCCTRLTAGLPNSYPRAVGSFRELTYIRLGLNITVSDNHPMQYSNLQACRGSDHMAERVPGALNC